MVELMHFRTVKYVRSELCQSVLNKDRFQPVFYRS